MAAVCLDMRGYAYLGHAEYTYMYIRENVRYMRFATTITFSLLSWYRPVFVWRQQCRVELTD